MIVMITATTPSVKLVRRLVFVHGLAPAGVFPVASLGDKAIR
jgi:hypothetical protein